MPDITANTSDGYVYSYQLTWSGARNAATGTAVNSSASSSAYGIRGERGASRGGGYNYTVARSFFVFDTSGVSAEVDTASLIIRGRYNGGGDVIAVQATSDISTLGTADFDAIEGWGGTIVTYSSELSTWTTSGWNSIALNALAKTHIEDNGTLYVCVMNYDYDYRDIAPTGYAANRNGLYYADDSTYKPYINYELVSTIPQTDAVFFGANF